MKPIPDEIRRFVLTSIPSVPSLEAALLLQAEPARRYTAAEVAARLYVPERAAAELLQALCAAGLVECADPAAGPFRYAPRDAALAASMTSLAALYAENLVGVTTLIHDATQKSARRFADAFKLRKDT